MKKKLICLLLLMCLLCSIMYACKPKKEITAEEAISVVLEDLGDDAQKAGDPHVHTGTYQNKDCYSIYITVKGESWIYIVTTDGEILAKGLGSHSH